MGDPLRPETTRGRLSAAFRVSAWLLGPLLVGSAGGCALLPGQGPVAAVVAISMESGRPAIVTPCVSPAVTYVGVAEAGSGEPSSHRAWAVTSRWSVPNPVLTEFPFFQTPVDWIARDSDLTALRDGVLYGTGIDRRGAGGVGPHFTTADLRALRPGEVWYYNADVPATKDDGRRVSRKDFERQARKLCSVRMGD